MTQLTAYQQQQLMHLHLTGEFSYKNQDGNKVARSAWTKMIDALVENGLIDRNAKVTEKGKRFCDEIHQKALNN